MTVWCHTVLTGRCWCLAGGGGGIFKYKGCGHKIHRCQSQGKRISVAIVVGAVLVWFIYYKSILVGSSCIMRAQLPALHLSCCK